MDFRPDAYVYEQVADDVQRKINAGTLKPGAALPNERAMAAEYGTSPMTIRRAVRELRERGLVVTLPNKGSFVL